MACAPCLIIMMTQVVYIQYMLYLRNMYRHNKDGYPLWVDVPTAKLTVMVEV